jgi:hypothetical protein
MYIPDIFCVWLFVPGSGKKIKHLSFYFWLYSGLLEKIQGGIRIMR